MTGKTVMTKWLPMLMLASLLAGCVSVKLVADYDEQIDKGVTALQRDTETFLVKLADAAGDRVAPYKANRAFYGEAHVAISSLRTRADALERNSLTVRMLDKLQANFAALEADHQSAEGIGKRELQLYAGGFNSQFTAILTFELAKRRGGAVDEGKASVPATPVPPGANR